MTHFTKQDLEQLLIYLKQDPTNTKLLNSVALAYMQVQGATDHTKALYYLEQAYKVAPALTSIHNLGWFLYFEMGNVTRGAALMHQAVQLKAEDYRPYYAHGYMLMEQGEYNTASGCMLIAAQYTNRRDLWHNIGCCHFMMGHYNTAGNYFKRAATPLDAENRSLFNLALVYYKVGNANEVRHIADTLYLEISETHNVVSGYEIALLYYLIDDIKKASDCVLKQGIDGIQLMEWELVSYILYSARYKVWKDVLDREINTRGNTIREMFTCPEKWGFNNKVALQVGVDELIDEIGIIKETITLGMQAPDVVITDSLFTEYCGCLLIE